MHEHNQMWHISKWWEMKFNEQINNEQHEEMKNKKTWVENKSINIILKLLMKSTWGYELNVKKFNIYFYENRKKDMKRQI